ncbi:acetylglutamate kinase [Geothrix sp. PMB-07]|uniref:acetylglutamate kinase n=1 Tax=Geothrix sp. PMB-07 TaxID=3068640 RepID=UPI002741B12A|nr:acetylglutamate kinase [Geothrix sp. PMB-07]WLT31434.1 acetylglutamate kinase [Geothrix sp. PMB-07]
MPLSPNPYAALKEASQYVRLFRGKTFVVKVGGDVLSEAKIRKALCEQIALLWSFSIRVVLVHGGGSELDAVCEAMHIPIEKVAGRRVTSPEVLDAAKMVFAGQVHMDLLADLQASGVPAVGLTGLDAGLVKAHKRPPVPVVPDGATEPQLVDFGLVGDIDAIDPHVLSHLLEGGFVPVVAPLSGGEDGAIYNTNADTIAASLAGALGAEKLFFLLAVPGLLKDISKASSLIPHATLEELAGFEARGIISGGMRPKLAAVKAALSAGVPSAHLVSGLAPDALLAEIFTNEGSGTMLVPGSVPGLATGVAG